jgi:hypothetical protein
MELITRHQQRSAVVGVGIGASQGGEPVVDVLMREEVAEAGRLAKQFPKQIGGVPVRVSYIGDLVPLTAGRVALQRPVTPGTSIAPAGSTWVGTLGAITTDGKSYYALSNNHVLAFVDTLPMGTDILQPAAADGGLDADVIGQLVRTVPLLSGVPDVDCALVSLTVEHRAVIDSLGSVTTVAAPRIGSAVRKVGRTSGLTHGTIHNVGVILTVPYPTCDVVLTDQFIVLSEGTPFSRGGDSGSMIVDEDRNAIGLVVAGSPLGCSGCEMARILARLGVHLA